MTRSPTTLITGGAGFIGSTIARTLADSGHRVVLADVQPPRGESEFILDPVSDMVDVVTMPVDSWAMVTDEIRKCRPNYVFHLAAGTNPVALPRNPLIYLERVYGSGWRHPDPGFKHSWNREAYLDLVRRPPSG